jgi:hypothetical protein
MRIAAHISCHKGALAGRHRPISTSGRVFAEEDQIKLFAATSRASPCPHSYFVLCMLDDVMAFLNAHASSTQLNDADEALCIQEIFNGQAKKVPVSGTKPYYGHPLGASAAIEGVVCALAIRDGLIPPTLNYQTPDPACDLDVVPNEPREKNLNYVLSNAFGFGGINSCVVYKKV